MDKQEARELLETFVDSLQKKPYQELVGLIRNPVCVEVGGESGATYQIEYEAFWDSDPCGLLRIMASIDDGGLLSAMFPTTVSFLMDREGQVQD